jgi:predicted polyphosphate/ATP-dependent NAD kinase
MAAPHAAIGIVVNPSSGKDVRRLVARASVFDNQEKGAIVRRAVSGAVSAGADHFAFMDDTHNIAQSAFNNLPVRIKVNKIDCAGTASALDTRFAANELNSRNVIATLILGGDGTSRAFVKGWRNAVLLALSTGTNNVFPQLAEATVAGAALGVIATGAVRLEDVANPVKIIDIDIENEEPDIALIDAAVTGERFIGARALLDAAELRCVLLTRAEPAAVGMTSVGGLIHPVPEASDQGLLLQLGATRRIVTAPIAPGLYQDIGVSSADPVALGESLGFEGPCVIALDGERERVIKPGQKFSMKITRTGPSVIDINSTMQLAACKGAFVRSRDA